MGVCDIDLALLAAADISTCISMGAALSTGAGEQLADVLVLHVNAGTIYYFILLSSNLSDKLELRFANLR